MSYRALHMRVATHA
jgi:hypothetical protein